MRALESLVWWPRPHLLSQGFLVRVLFVRYGCTVVLHSHTENAPYTRDSHKRRRVVALIGHNMDVLGATLPPRRCKLH